MQYRNPKPVVVGLVFRSIREVLVVKRAIEPFIGQWALPGGYIEEGDTWQSRLKDEIWDEAQVEVSESHMRLYDVRTTPDGTRLLVFAVIPPDGIIKVHPFSENREVSERQFAALDHVSIPSLCFSLHQETLERYRGEHWGHRLEGVGG